jgi:hypothetical protein
MRYRPDTIGTFNDQRLNVFDEIRAGRGIADMADADVSRQFGARLFGQDGINQSQAFG